VSDLTDKEILDWLQEQGCGIALINDDEGAWIVAGNGMQAIRSLMAPDAIWDTTYMVDAEEAKDFRPTVREAVIVAMARKKEREEAV
jgi:hypothetical protein